MYRFIASLLMLKGGYHVFQDFQNPEEMKRQTIETCIRICKEGKEMVKQIKAGIQEHAQTRQEREEDESSPKE